jgi:catechol 2,3-dioxygenase-like lactoylglutathione lyase family enzyme
MKRFHVHLHVTDMAQSIGFYSRLFDAQPAKQAPDHAKWMLDDPAVNVAISAQGEHTGLDHLGIQPDDPAAYARLKARAQAAGLAMLNEGETTCCYARSHTHWITDPQGIAWEHFQTLADIPVFHQAPANTATRCC